ncbi:MAG: hypothetical protein ACOZF0_16490 [Thermodesulfobacteriota bacterium]
MTEVRNPYTCKDYRSEMLLLGLNRRLAEGNLSEHEKEAIRNDILRLEKEMGLR